MRHAVPRAPRAPAGALLASILAGVVLSLGAIVVGCGSEPSSPAATEVTDTTSTVSDTATPTSAQDAGTAPQRLADGIIATWTEALRQLNLLLEGMPDPGAVEGQVRALKEKYVREFVELGRTRETLDASEKASVDSRLRSAMNAMGNDVVYRTYADTYDAYVETGGGLDFWNLLASFNILTQYADFLLLKQQAPEEAARLGVE